MIRHHALTSLVSVAVAFAVVQSLRVDAPDKSWDSREGCAQLFSREVTQPKKPPEGSPTATTVEKWRGLTRLRVAHAINSPNSNRPTGVRLHLVSMNSFFSTSPIYDDAGNLIQPGSCSGVTSVRNGGVSTPANLDCSTSNAPGGNGGTCSTSNGTTGNATCSTNASNGYCSTNAGGNAASECSTSAVAPGVTNTCSTTKGGGCSTNGDQTAGVLCSAQGDSNQTCSTGDMGGGIGGFCSAAGGVSNEPAACSAGGGGDSSVKCSTSGTQADQRCSTRGDASTPTTNTCSTSTASNGGQCTIYGAAAGSCSVSIGGANTCSTKQPNGTVKAPKATGICDNTNL